MIIAVDAAIPYWEEAFSNVGSTRPFSAGKLKPEDIRDADILAVRSVTSVNASLLEGSSIQFVAAASAGIDHIDQNYLKARGIRFIHAAGCNADSVSEYIVTALYTVASRRKWELKGKSLAVIGVGNVGSRVARKARALGMDVLLCDPPLRDSTGDPQYRPLDEVLAADILSFHVPLVFEGPYPTWHMVDRKTLDRLSPKQFLVNSSRGAVIDNRELKAALQESRLQGAILDVWEEEPRVDYSLLELLDIGTSHVAGSSLDGKIRATEMIREAICQLLGIHLPLDLAKAYPKTRLLHPSQEAKGQDGVLSVLLQAYDILKDDAALRALHDLAPEDAAMGFELLRTKYAFRPEFHHFIVDLSQRHIDLAEALIALDFKLAGKGHAVSG